MRLCIEKLIQNKTVSRHDAAAACRQLCETENTAQAAALLSLMSARGETVAEINGFCDVMRETMICVPYTQPAIDIVGTGGDGANTVNISTAASLVVASCGATVIKHGNRASSSRCGSGDFLEACGVALYTSPVQALHCIEQTGFVYLHKPAYHPLAEHVKKIREQLQIRTIFNLLGPILDPAQVCYLVLGVYTPDIMSLYANVLSDLKIKHAFIVHGNGLDELNCLGINQVIEIVHGVQKAYTIDPADYGLAYCSLSDLKGGSPADNRQILAAVLKGERTGAIANTLALNAGVALYTYGHVESINAGVAMALDALSCGAPFQTLQRVVDFFNHA